MTTIIPGQLDALDLLVAGQSSEPITSPAMLGAFISPPPPDEIERMREEHYKQWNVHKGNWRPFRGWSDREATGKDTPHHAWLYMAALGCQHWGQTCYCVGGMVYRVHCRGCSWWSAICSTGNAALEDHLDHCWPGWRELPVVEGTMQSNGGYKYAMPDDYPSEWMVPGAPTLDCRGTTKYATRHVPGYNQFGGVKVGVIRECKQHKGRR